jgi:hypothetical protein
MLEDGEKVREREREIRLFLVHSNQFQSKYFLFMVYLFMRFLSLTLSHSQSFAKIYYVLKKESNHPHASFRFVSFRIQLFIIFLFKRR